MWLELDFVFDKGLYINFTKVAIASRASTYHQVRKTMLPYAPDEPPSGCLGDPAPFFLEYISELVDVLWLVWPSLDASPKDVLQMFNWRQVLGLCWPWESCDTGKQQVGRQHQGMDRPGVHQVPEGSGEQEAMEDIGCEIIHGAPVTVAVKG